MTRTFSAVALVLAFACSISAQSPNGRNVKMVVFGTGATESGMFRMAGYAGEWVETGPDHAQVRFRFRERTRDDWSVYLRDASRGVNVQLDLHTKKVMYSDASSPKPRELAQILGADARVNGWLVTRVSFGDSPHAGSYTQNGRQWIERGGRGGKPRFRFDETGRDDWSVYLHDASRKVDLQIDLHTGTIYYTDPDTPREALYRIKASR